MGVNFNGLKGKENFCPASEEVFSIWISEVFVWDLRWDDLKRPKVGTASEVMLKRKRATSSATSLLDLASRGGRDEIEDFLSWEAWIGVPVRIEGSLIGSECLRIDSNFFHSFPLNIYN